MNCKSCGRKLESGSNFCPNCGANNKEDKGKAIASLIIGIISIFIGVAFIPLPIIGLVLGCSYKGKCAEKTAGVILNTISLVFSILMIIGTIVLFFVFGTRIADTVLEKSLDNIDFSDINVQIESDWDKYSNYVDKNDKLDTTTNIMGNWKELSDKRSYFKIDEVEFIYYEDINNLENKYYTGTYTFKDGKEELGGLVLDNKTFNKFFDKLMDGLEGINFSIFKIENIKGYENGKEIPINLTEEESYSYMVIINHDDAVELIVSEFNDQEEKHYYKVLEN